MVAAAFPEVSLPWALSKEPLAAPDSRAQLLQPCEQVLSSPHLTDGGTGAERVPWLAPAVLGHLPPSSASISLSSVTTHKVTWPLLIRGPWVDES